MPLTVVFFFPLFDLDLSFELGLLKGWLFKAIFGLGAPVVRLVRVTFQIAIQIVNHLTPNCPFTTSVSDAVLKHLDSEHEVKMD